MLTQYEILNEVDPEWQEHYAGDIGRAWAFYWQYARAEIERVKREHREQAGAIV